MVNLSLFELLTVQKIFQGRAQAIWDSTELEKEAEMIVRSAGPVWPSLEFGYDNDPRWHAGWRCKLCIEYEDAMIFTEGWALRAVDETPEAAIRAVLNNMGVLFLSN